MIRTLILLLACILGGLAGAEEEEPDTLTADVYPLYEMGLSKIREIAAGLDDDVRKQWINEVRRRAEADSRNEIMYDKVLVGLRDDETILALGTALRERVQDRAGSAYTFFNQLADPIIIELVAPALPPPPVSQTDLYTHSLAELVRRKIEDVQGIPPEVKNWALDSREWQLEVHLFVTMISEWWRLNEKAYRARAFQSLVPGPDMSSFDLIPRDKAPRSADHAPSPAHEYAVEQFPGSDSRTANVYPAPQVAYADAIAGGAIKLHAIALGVSAVVLLFLWQRRRNIPK